MGKKLDRLSQIQKVDSTMLTYGSNSWYLRSKKRDKGRKRCGFMKELRYSPKKKKEDNSYEISTCLDLTT